MHSPWQRLAAAARKRLRASLSRIAWASMALPIAMVVAGCGSATEDLAKQVDQMQAEIRELRATALTGQDRLDALEDRAGVAGDEAAVADDEGARRAADRPQLDVVRLTPEAKQTLSEEVDAATMSEPDQSDESRPVVRANQHGGRIDERAATKGRRARGGAMAGRR